VGKAQHYRLLKFILNNNSKHRVQVVAWNAEIERIEFHLQPNISLIFIFIFLYYYTNIIIILKNT